MMALSSSLSSVGRWRESARPIRKKDSGVPLASGTADEKDPKTRFG